MYILNVAAGLPFVPLRDFQQAPQLQVTAGQHGNQLALVEGAILVQQRLLYIGTVHSSLDKLTAIRSQYCQTRLSLEYSLLRFGSFRCCPRSHNPLVIVASLRASTVPLHPPPYL